LKTRFEIAVQLSAISPLNAEFDGAGFTERRATAEFIFDNVLGTHQRIVDDMLWLWGFEQSGSKTNPP